MKYRTASAGPKPVAGPARPPLERALKAFTRLLPVLTAMLLLTSLVLAWLPMTGLASALAGDGPVDVLLGTLLGSVAAGHPSAGYVLGGELRAGGVGLITVTALITAWVTVGVVQLPAEALTLGRRFALVRNLVCLVLAVVLAYLTVAGLALAGGY
ncbi:hypothetical protein SAMN05421721_10472 [Ectothiorhodospira mobilis]|uniref:Permease n=2 Tax=Ectothiorhodospira mobilis TaxID=195064 RepID=A0A1I4QDV2_ECTMO|nr:hypothetical protein SAMN05421721_10472 [Ectothiorhodospira mobilis]